MYSIIKPASDFCSYVTDGTHDSPKVKEDGRYLITSKHLGRYELDFFRANKISEQDYQKIIQRSSVAQWDILISMIGTIGNIYLETSEIVEYACKNVGIFKMGGDERNSKWLYYYLQSPQAREYILTSSRGTTQGYIPLNALRKFPVEVVDDVTRDRIVSVLWSLDMKIKENHRINKNLQQQAMALFSKYYDQTNDVVPFTSIIQVLGGGTPKTGNPLFWNGPIPFFTPKDVGNPYTLVTEKTITKLGLSRCNSRLYPVNTVFVTARGTVGKIGLPGIPMAMNQSCYALIGKGLDQLMVYFYTQRVVQTLKHKASGAVFDAITTRDFETETVRLISVNDASDFLSVARPIYDRILNNCLENQRLASLRDSLLPHLMSGEIDVDCIEI